MKWINDLYWGILTWWHQFAKDSPWCRFDKPCHAIRHIIIVRSLLRWGGWELQWILLFSIGFSVVYEIFDYIVQGADLKDCLRDFVWDRFGDIIGLII